MTVNRPELITSGIYAIRCVKTGQEYIGSAVNIYHRWAVHRNRLTDGKHHSWKLQRAWKKLGEICFEFVVIEFCPKEQLIEREQFYLDSSNAVELGFNVNPIAESRIGTKWSKETRAKMAIARKGRKFPPEVRAKLAAAKLGKPGPKHTAESKAKISANSANAQIYRLISPTGEVIEIKNLHQFCREQSLHPTSLSEVVHGRSPSHKDWRSANHQTEPTGGVRKKWRFAHSLS